MSAKTQFVVVRVTKDWSAHAPEGDRRRYRRFEHDEVAGTVALIETDGPKLVLDHCTLVDVSYGGMCLLAETPLAIGSAQRFLVDFAAPFEEVVLVKARVAWLRASDKGLRMGVEFVESSKGWLGPEHDPEE